MIALFAGGVWMGLSLPSAFGHGGPPMLTDDPGTPGDGHWEINIASAMERSITGAWRAEMPLLDINYGVGERVQLKYEVPWVIQGRRGEENKRGLGESEVGVKWRFLDEGGAGIAASVYPQFRFDNPTSSARRGLVERTTAFILPIQVEGKLGADVEWTLELGQISSSPATDRWLYGVALGHGFSERFEVAVEVHGESRHRMNDDELIANIGARFKIDRHRLLMVSIGRSLNRAAGDEFTFVGYAGLQMTY